MSGEQQEDDQTDDDDGKQADDGRCGGAQRVRDALDDALSRCFGHKNDDFCLGRLAVVVGHGQREGPGACRQVLHGPCRSGEIHIASFLPVKVGVKMRTVPLVHQILFVAGCFNTVRSRDGQVVAFGQTVKHRDFRNDGGGGEVQDAHVHGLVGCCAVIVGDGHRDHAHATRGPRRLNVGAAEFTIVVACAITVNIDVRIQIPTHLKARHVRCRVRNFHRQIQQVAFKHRRVPW